jgi:hypothetical protein
MGERMEGELLSVCVLRQRIQNGTRRDMKVTGVVFLTTYMKIGKNKFYK